MKEKIEQLKDILSSIETVIHFLEGKTAKKNLRGDGTIEAQIYCFADEGAMLSGVIHDLIKDHGCEQCPHN